MSTRQTARRTTRALVASTAALTAMAALAACGGDSTGPGGGNTPTQRLDIIPASGTLPGLSGKTLSAAPGDTARLSGVLNSSAGGSTPASSLTWNSTNTAIATVDASGLVRAVANGTTTVVAHASQYADTLTVVVSACGTAPTLNLSVGQVQSYAAGAASTLCIPSSAAAAEYALVAFNADSADRSGRETAATVAVTATGVVTPTQDIAQIEGGGLSLSRGAGPSFGLGALASGPQRLRSASFDRGLRETAARVLAPHMAAARTARTRPAGLRLAAAAAPLTVGQVIQLNTSLEPCDTTAPQGLKRRAGRVVAISNKAIVVADTLNPSGGFTTADYEGYAAAFDSLAYPVDVANFGDPYDVDKNGKSIIFFTSAVNAMTPAKADYYVGGFFYERDLFPNTFGLSVDDGGCGGSNFAEMFYMLVPDPAGAINSNVFSKAFVDGVTVGTLAHEFQHLINADRRIYVNDADDWEDTWLNEGLSHIAEELTYYHASGLAPHTRLDATGIRASTLALNAYNMYQKGNLGRQLSFLDGSEGASPYADNDDLETRGATWLFLRYAADRINGTDATLWQKLVASTKIHGMQNLRTALGLTTATLGDWFNDWAVANYADGLVTPSDTRFTYRSWNHRSVIGSLKTATGQAAYPIYPIISHAMANGVAQNASVRGGAAAYFRVAVPANGQARVTVAGASGAALPSTMRVSAVRVK
ncbi:MAG: Ig-like domain-containing protein [Gemmatirosa sp.]|nr:Ig-like domain-containing protein [Gemmatirosa sp.]